MLLRGFARKPKWARTVDSIWVRACLYFNSISFICAVMASDHSDAFSFLCFFLELLLCFSSAFPFFVVLVLVEHKVEGDLVVFFFLFDF